MNKELKDGLKTFISVGLRDYTSINEVLKADYERYKTNGSGFNTATYRGKKLKIIYDVVLGEKGEVIEETDFITIRKDLEEQILSVNEFYAREGK